MYKSPMNAAQRKRQKQQRSNLAKTAIKLLEAQDNIKFYMGSYADNQTGFGLEPNEIKNECGTNCCFAGYGPIALKNGRYADDWSDYMFHTFGVASTFLFGGSWLNSRKQAAARALIWLQNGGAAPEGWTFKRRYYPKWSKARLIRELDKYTIKRKKTAAA